VETLESHSDEMTSENLWFLATTKSRRSEMMMKMMSEAFSLFQKWTEWSLAQHGMA
jgi:hypothetical protein